MNYNGQTCSVCNIDFKDGDDVVVCPVCGTPHHRDCWKENGICVNADRHDEGFVWKRTETATDVAGERQTAYKMCPVCGEKNDVNEPVCKNCGERLKADRTATTDRFPMNSFDPFGGNIPGGNYTTPPNPNNYSPYQNVYAADARMMFSEGETIDDIPVTEIAEFIQKNSIGYIAGFKKTEEKKSKLSWNWAAAIFSVFWCCYRKMTAVGLALVALFFSSYLLSTTVPEMVYRKYRPEVYAEYTAQLDELADELQKAMNSGDREAMTAVYSKFAGIIKTPIMATTYIMQITLFVLISVIFGFFGNYFYKRKVLKDIRTMRNIAGDSMSYHMLLRQRGGVSVANVLIPIICYIVVNLISGSV